MSERIDKLAGELMILRLPDGPHVTKLTREEALKNARQIARELFPPMAKPLVFGGSNIEQWADTGYDQGYYMYFNRTEKVWIVQWRVCGNSYEALRPCKYANSDAAKAACEAHHQARFLEQLA